MMNGAGAMASDVALAGQLRVGEALAGAGVSDMDAAAAAAASEVRGTTVPSPPGPGRLELVWACIVAGYVASVVVVAWLTGLPAWLVFVAVLAGCIVMPLNLLVLCNVVFLAHSLSHLDPDDPLASRLAASAAFTTFFGFASGLGLLVAAKFVPYGVQRLVSRLGLPLAGTYHRVTDAFVPQAVQIGFGVFFTLASEFLCISPVAAVQLVAMGQLLHAGEDFDRAWASESRRKGRKLVVMIHGNGFNECQWLYGRFLLRSRSWSDDCDFLTVNVFGGPSMRAPTPHTHSIEDCSKIALEQIQQQMELRGLDPGSVVLMGHSLGGLIAAHIKEYSAKDIALPVTSVVAMSAPFHGSDLLGFGERANIVSSVTGTIRDHFRPSAESTKQLRARMKQTVVDDRDCTYFAVSGTCDHLVRPHSALPSFLPDDAKVLVPYLGHFNIKVSLRAWAAVIRHLESTSD